MKINFYCVLFRLVFHSAVCGVRSLVKPAWRMRFHLCFTSGISVTTSALNKDVCLNYQNFSHSFWK